MWPKVMKQKVVSPEDGRRNDDICIDSPEIEPQAFGKYLAPSLRLAAGVFIADEQRCLHLFEKLLQ